MATCVVWKWPNLVIIMSSFTHIKAYMGWIWAWISCRKCVNPLPYIKNNYGTCQHTSSGPWAEVCTTTCDVWKWPNLVLIMPASFTHINTCMGWIWAWTLCRKCVNPFPYIYKANVPARPNHHACGQRCAPGCTAACDVKMAKFGVNHVILHTHQCLDGMNLGMDII